MKGTKKRNRRGDGTDYQQQVNGLDNMSKMARENLLQEIQKKKLATN